MNLLKHVPSFMDKLLYAFIALGTCLAFLFVGSIILIYIGLALGIIR
jgi:hypothetical protein